MFFMSALEDIELEKSRAILGALVLLTQSADKEIPSIEFVKINCLGGISYLSANGYAAKKLNNKDNFSYILLGKGWQYAERIFEEVKQIKFM